MSRETFYSINNLRLKDHPAQWREPCRSRTNRINSGRGIEDGCKDPERFSCRNRSALGSRGGK